MLQRQERLVSFTFMEKNAHLGIRTHEHLLHSQVLNSLGQVVWEESDWKKFWFSARLEPTYPCFSGIPVNLFVKWQLEVTDLKNFW